MKPIYLKRASQAAASECEEIRRLVGEILADIERDGEHAARHYAHVVDRWHGDIVVGQEIIEAASRQLATSVKDDIRVAHDNVLRFALAQKHAIAECAHELAPGLMAGQRQVPVSSAGCYVQGGHNGHVASAIMTITTARAAGVANITACAAPIPSAGIAPELLFAMQLCGADKILSLGGVQAVAAMAFGLFDTPRSAVVVGAGDEYVCQATRMLFGRIGIDALAGPSSSMVIASAYADPYIVAWNLVGQAERGCFSRVRLVTDSMGIAENTMAHVPALVANLKEHSAHKPRAAWRHCAEVIVCENREQVALVADDYAPDQLQVQASHLDWWFGRLASHGSLYLGEDTTLPFGNKSHLPNHLGRTPASAGYPGGVSIHDFMRTSTWQRRTRADASSSAGSGPVEPRLAPIPLSG